MIGSHTCLEFPDPFRGPGERNRQFSFPSRNRFSITKTSTQAYFWSILGLINGAGEEFRGTKEKNCQSKYLGPNGKGQEAHL
jgi:hypothetical protein